MEEEQLKQLEAFGFSRTQNRLHYTFAEALNIMKESAKDAVTSYEMSHKNDGLIAHYLLDASIKMFENYTEAFKDIVTALFALGQGKTLFSLAECIRVIKQEYAEGSKDGNAILDFLLQRNKLVHHYYNYEFMRVEYQVALDNYADGLLDVYEFLLKLTIQYDLLNRQIVKS